MNISKNPILSLIKVNEIYAPQPIDSKNILIANGTIAAIGNNIQIPEDLPCEIIELNNGRAVPGFIDQHVHVTGGGGEGGAGTRCPEITAAQIYEAGITSVVGLTGTDSITRSNANLLAKVRALRSEGISAYMYTGAYRVPPPTLTGDLQQDLMWIPEIIGTGEIAISDHRSSQPTQSEIERLVADTRVGAMLAGKKGLCHFHLGSGDRGLEPLRRLLIETEIPADQINPTHVNRKMALLEESAKFSLEFGVSLDVTAFESLGENSLSAEKAVAYLIEKGVDPGLITISSDCQGSLPIFNDAGQLVELRVATNKAFIKDWRAIAQSGILSFEQALALVTRNVAEVLGLSETKGQLSVGADADITVLDKDLKPIAVFGRGRRLI